MTSSHLSSPSPLPTLPHKPIPRPSRHKSIQVLGSTSHRRRPQQQNKVGSPEPPWPVLPPNAPRNPLSGESPPLFDFQLRSPATGIPFSLRLVQLRKKRMNSPRPCPPSPDLGSVGNAVWSLASIMEEIQRSILSEDDQSPEDTVDSVSRDTGDSVVWLFRKVFSSSPNLAVGLLFLMAKFFVAPTKMEKRKALAVVAEGMKLDDVNGSKAGPPEIGKYKSWSDVGILDEAEEKTFVDRWPDYLRRGMAYENMIINEKTNSLILSNYAQLLYQYEQDLDRANQYFNWAVNAEPADGEAMSRYAFFLWHARGDLEGAEEMFLEAIQADPENDYHRSNYACFLWNTGGQDTCFPLEDSQGGGVCEGP